VHLSDRLASVAANVRRLRLKKGWTQERLAEETSLAVVTVQTIERGRANMTLAVLFALADALEVKPGMLFRPAAPVERPAGRPRRRTSRRQ
jgi:transcriptional regulator with XRE-family HTH domain